MSKVRSIQSVRWVGANGVARFINVGSVFQTLRVTYRYGVLEVKGYMPCGGVEHITVKPCLSKGELVMTYVTK